MADQTHYDTLDVSPEATQAEIKQAYRHLVKQFHPDCNPQLSNHDHIAVINIAYEVLSDPHKRQSYDQQLDSYRYVGATSHYTSREQRTAAAQQYYRERHTGYDSDEQLQRWLMQVYQPVSRLLYDILKPLKSQLNDLSADPFDDELLGEFQAYLDDCRLDLQRAQQIFRSMPNPANVAGVAANLYYCLNQVGDGIDELERFTTSYDEHYLHTGQELFRIATGLRREAQAAIRQMAV